MLELFDNYFAIVAAVVVAAAVVGVLLSNVWLAVWSGNGLVTAAAVVVFLYNVGLAEQFGSGFATAAATVAVFLAAAVDIDPQLVAADAGQACGVEQFGTVDSAVAAVVVDNWHVQVL